MLRKSIVSTVLMVLIMISQLYTFASDNLTLSDLGIVDIDIKNMSDEKKSFYNNLKILNIKEETKYYQIEVRKSNSESEERKNKNQNNEYETKIIEITKSDFEKQVFQLNKKVNVNINASNTDSINLSWVKMTTKIALIEGDEYVVTNDISYFESNGFLQPVNTHIIGIGVGANYSVIKDSEYLRHEYTLYSSNLGIYEPGQYDYYWTAYEKSAQGYAFVIQTYETQINNRAFMALGIKANVSNTTVVDAYGHYAKYTKSVTPSISFSINGASIDITPTTNLIKAPNTHVQLYR
ncbi:hypothetical protein Calhy_2104 [Caldicellulosiruptor hydrothermalis 108]|uniref:Uncharacterized protein n=1 Tax=Caldicellulosiruptor hydrothermalis (strain DSM 18901 / VKM B-2411 / 108) TaxID=632292 RepID=E4Q7G8_CALH1|nr:hypothetical protein [Caldicellulosiruptor hydrothermalis]ADQ07813.1 hypothetical protein Calhy_2104 [Caldicellulosiruptor hydrothermalis 108]